MRVGLFLAVRRARGMNADVGHHALADEFLGHEGADEVDTLLPRQFAR